MASIFEGRADTLRWLIAGTFSAEPRGTIVRVSGERFSAVMGKLAPKAAVEVRDRLGKDATRRVEIAFKRPRDFRLGDVVASVDPLRQLAEIADALERSRDPINEHVALGRVVRLVGDGKLAAALREGGPVVEEVESAPPKTTDGSGNGNVQARGIPLDAIFGKADLPSTRAPSADPKSGLDAFIGTMRGDKPAKKRPDEAPRIAAARTIRGVAEATACDILDACGSLEISWRGLRMVVAEAPGNDDLVIELIDARSEDLAQQLATRLDREVIDRPDAVFLASAVGDPQVLGELARVGLKHQVMIVASVPQEAYGGHGEERDPAPEAWTSLQADPAARWLGAVGNDVVLAAEEATTLTRTVVGAPALSLAAVLAASVGRTGALAGTVGRAGALTAPAAHDVEIGAGDPVTVPTRTFAGVEDQRRGEQRGVAVIGSERGSDQVMFTTLPPVSAMDDAKSIPTQILVGRALRLGRYVRDRLPPDASASEVADALEQASGAFLPRGPRGAVSFRGTWGESGKLSVDVAFGGQLTGGALGFSFEV